MTANKAEVANRVDYRFKILYAVGMIMVVCGHAEGGGISLISYWFPYEGIHMALFMFGSGYFYKRTSEENMGKYIIRKAKNLLIPLYVYNLIYGLIVQITRLKGFTIGGDFTLYNLVIAPINNGHQFLYNMGGWFVVSLFLVEIYNICIRKVLKRFLTRCPEMIFLVISIILGLIGNQLSCLGFYDGWWRILSRLLYFLPFYELGILYKTCLEKYDKRIPNFWYFVVIFVIKLGIIYYYGKMVSYSASWCNNFEEGPVMPIVAGYLGIALWLRIASILEPVIGRSKWINLIADNTYSIMVNHFLGFMLVKSVYAIISKFYPKFYNFDWIRFKTDIWWYYLPGGVEYTMIIYLVAGIAVPIMIQKIIDKTIEKINKRKFIGS